MPHLKRIVSSTLTVLLLTAVCAGASVAEEAAAKGAHVQTSQPSPGDTLLKVNGKPITRQEMDRAVKIMLVQTGTKQLLPDALKQAQAAILEQLTNSELLYQASLEMKMKDLDKQVDEKLAKDRAAYKTDAEYEAALARMEMDPSQLKEFTRRDIAINNMIEQRFAGKVKVEESEAKKFYDDNRAKYFERGASVRASHILIGLGENASPEQKDEAKAKADALLARLKKGEDFGELAKKESTCPSKEKGGDLGVFGSGDMVPPFEKAAFALQPGEMSGVVATVFGYHIIKLTEAIPARVEPYEEVKGKIMDHLKREKVRAELPAFIKELREKAKIEKA